LRVAAFFDGRPGHEKQSRGILQSLGDMVPLEVIEVVVEKVSPLLRINQLMQLLFIFPGIRDKRLVGVDLLLGTGSRTHLPILLAKKKYRVPAVICMSSTALLRPYFDLCFVPEHDGLKASQRVFTTVGAPNCCRNLGQHRQDRGLIAIGGIDAKSHRWDSQAMTSMMRQLVESEKNTQWTLTSSPRTPEETIHELQKLANVYDNVEFRDFRQTPPGWIESQYAACQTAWVSGDSISMIYEALSAGCKVGLLPLEWRDHRGKFKSNEEQLLRKNLVLPFWRWQQGERWQQTNTHLNEAQRCAERIMRIWQPTN
jgi:uncharacterized protein